MWWFRILCHTALGGLLLLATSGCGFHLRGNAPLPFSSIYVMGAQNSNLVNGLKRALQSNSGTRLVDQQQGAAAVAQVVSEVREKIILSLTAKGVISEYQ